MGSCGRFTQARRKRNKDPPLPPTWGSILFPEPPGPGAGYPTIDLLSENMEMLARVWIFLSFAREIKENTMKNYEHQ